MSKFENKEFLKEMQSSMVEWMRSERRFGETKCLFEASKTVDRCLLREVQPTLKENV